MKERRRSPPPEPLSTEFGQGTDAETSPSHDLIRDPRTGLYTMRALYEFIRYEIDGGAQTERNERFVTPVCVVAIGVDALRSMSSEPAREELIESIAKAIARITRRADRLAREGNDLVALLRRTLSRRARDFYAPHLTGAVVEVSREVGPPTTLSFGISSLTEHLVRDPSDMIRKAFTALEEAKRRGPGSVVVYDLREMVEPEK